MVRICTKIRLYLKKIHFYRAIFGNGISGNQYLIEIVKSQGKYDFLLGANISHPFITLCLGFYILSFFFTGGEPLPGPAGLLLRQQPDFIQNRTGRYLNVSRAKIGFYCRRCLYFSVNRVDRVSGFLSSRGSPRPFGSKGGTHSLAGEGAGVANSDEGTDTLVLQNNPSTPPSVTVTYTETLFLNFEGAQESIPRNPFSSLCSLAGR